MMQSVLPETRFVHLHSRGNARFSIVTPSSFPFGNLSGNVTESRKKRIAFCLPLNPARIPDNQLRGDLVYSTFKLLTIHQLDD